MGEATKIQWTGDTFNMWRGCTKVHEGCKFCYAEREAKRFPMNRGVWGPSGTRVVASEDMWRQPLKWNREAEKAGERRKVFCSSLADVFEDWDGPMLDAKGSVLFSGNVLSRPWRDTGNPKTDKFLTMGDVRLRLFDLIDATPWLDWQLLTKRPENVRRMWPTPPDSPCRDGQGNVSHDYMGDRCLKCGSPKRQNVWIGTSISDQKTADEYVPELLKLRDLTPCLFLSVEPLVGPVNLPIGWAWECPECGDDDERGKYPLVNQKYCGNCAGDCGRDVRLDRKHRLIDWVIVGGESGTAARPCDVAWIRSLVRDCKSADVPAFVKQLGAVAVETVRGPDDEYDERELRLKHPKGGDPDEWPEDLRVREFPRLERVGAS